MAIDFKAIRGVVFDMDGVLWRGEAVIPEARPFMDFLTARGVPYVLATNNSTSTVAEFAAKCARLGLPAGEAQVVSASMILLDVLQKKHPAGTPIYIIGSASMAGLFTDAGYVINPETARIVLVGLDIHINYEKLAIALRRLFADAEFYATNADATFPTPEGLAPGAGSLVAALEKASGRSATVIGKPAPAVFQGAAERLGCAPHEALMIGDRLDTDIEGAQLAGLPAALVLTGVSTRTQIVTIVPDGVYDTLTELRKTWEDG